jgi:hypothetical protein
LLFGAAMFNRRQEPDIGSRQQSQLTRIRRIVLGVAGLRVTPYNCFLAGFLTLLLHYIGKTKLALLGCHCANRTPESAKTIGFFINRHLWGSS